MSAVRILRWPVGWRLAGASLAFALGACSISQEHATRPTDISDIKPSSGPVRHANVNMPAEVEREHLQSVQARPLVNLPKPLLAEIVIPDRPLQCVPYARELSDVQIRGNAWTWWDQADGRYARDSRPKVGSVLVLKRKEQPGSLGHVAYVEEIIDSRMIIVSHANWLNEGRLHINTPVLDVSEANDWSKVRFWNTPGHHFGGNIYRPYGFILPNHMVASR